MPKVVWTSGWRTFRQSARKLAGTDGNRPGWARSGGGAQHSPPSGEYELIFTSQGPSGPDAATCRDGGKLAFLHGSGHGPTRYANLPRMSERAASRFCRRGRTTRMRPPQLDPLGPIAGPPAHLLAGMVFFCELYTKVAPVCLYHSLPCITNHYHSCANTKHTLLRTHAVS